MTYLCFCSTLYEWSSCINSFWAEINSSSGELDVPLNSGKMGLSGSFKIIRNPSWSFVHSHMQEVRIFTLVKKVTTQTGNQQELMTEKIEIHHLSHLGFSKNFLYAEHQHETSPRNAWQATIFFSFFHNSSLTDCFRLTHGFNLGASISFINGFFFSFKWWFLFVFACNVCKMIWDAFCTCVQ